MLKASLQSLPSCQSRSLTTVAPEFFFTEEVGKFIQKVLTYDKDSDFSQKRHFSTKMPEFMNFLLETDIKVLYESLLLHNGNHYGYFACDSQSLKCNSEYYLEWKNYRLSTVTLMQLYHIYLFKTIGKRGDCIIHFHSDFMYDLKQQDVLAYLEVYYQGLSLSQCLDVIHQVWKSHPDIEIKIVLTYCDTLYENTDNIRTNMSALREYCMATDTKVLQDWMNSDVPKSTIIFIQLYHIYTLKNTTENDSIIPQKLIIDYLKHEEITAYLDKYYQGLSPSECLDTIHQVWKSLPKMEFQVISTYCDTLYKNINDMRTTMSVLRDYFMKTNTKVLQNMMKSYYVRLNPITFIQIYHINALKTSDNGRCITKAKYLTGTHRDLQHQGITAYLDIYYQGLSPSQCFDTIHQVWKSYPNDRMTEIFRFDRKHKPKAEYRFKLAYFQTLLTNKKYQTCIRLICSNRVFVDETINNEDCQTRQEYCVILLRLLNHFDLSGNAIGIQLTMNALLNFKISLINQREDFRCRCYCYMGSEKCKLNCKSQKEYDFDGKNRYHITKKNLKKSINLFRTFKSIRRSTWIKNITGWEQNYYWGFTENLEERMGLADDDDDDAWFKRCVSFGKTMVIPTVNDTEMGFEKLIEKLIDTYGITESVINILSLLSSVEMMPVTKDSIVNMFLRIIKTKHCDTKLVLAQLVLDVNIDEKASKCPLVDQLTLQLAKVLDLEETYTEDKNKVIYKCYCFVRHAMKNRNTKDIDIDRYKKHFIFIRYMEKQEEMERQTSISQLLILLMMLLFDGSSSGGHHKSAELKKFLSLKYEYDDAILYLLWCSGDVEINPGPTFQKLEKLPNSQKERNWLFDICSVLVKLTFGISEDDFSCKSKIWSTKPTTFPGELSNPRKKSSKDINAFFYDLLHYCKIVKKLSIPDPYQKEIDLYEADKTLLLKSFISRLETTQITKAIRNLFLYNGEQMLQQSLIDMNIAINYGPNALSSSGGMVERSQITRDLAVTLCRICKGLKPTLKSDGIWKEPPQGWNPLHPYYSPHNAGKRTDKNPDRTLLNNLLKHIKANHLPLPYIYKGMVKAWEDHNIDDLRRIYTIYVYTATIEHSLKYLKLEGLLKDNEDKLKHIGLTLHPKWFNSDDSGQSNAKKRKVSTKTVTKKTCRPGRGYSSRCQGSSSPSDSQGVSVCQHTVHLNTSIIQSKCTDNQSDDTICHTVDKNALASYTGSSRKSQTRRKSVLQPDNIVSPTRKSRKRKVTEKQEKKQKSVKKCKTPEEEYNVQSTSSLTLLPNNSSSQIPSNEDTLHSDKTEREIDDVTSRIVSLVEDLQEDFGQSQQTQQLKDTSAPTDEQNYKVSNTEVSALSLYQSSSTYTFTTSTVSTDLPPTNTVVLPPNVDFLYADIMVNLSNTGLSSTEQTNNDEIIKELQRPPPELNSVSKSLNMTSQELFDTIDRLTKNGNGASSLSKLSNSEQHSVEDLMTNQSKISRIDQPYDNVTIQSKMILADQSSDNDTEMEIDLTIFDKCDVENVKNTDS